MSRARKTQWQVEVDADVFHATVPPVLNEISRARISSETHQTVCDVVSWWGTYSTAPRVDRAKPLLSSGVEHQSVRIDTLFFLDTLKPSVERPGAKVAIASSAPLRSMNPSACRSRWRL